MSWSLTAPPLALPPRFPCATVAPGAPLRANVIGAHYVLSKQMPKGEKYLRRATELDPQDGEIRYNLGATLAAMGKIEDAIVEFERAQERGIEVAGEVVGKLREGLKGNKGGGE